MRVISWQRYECLHWGGWMPVNAANPPSLPSLESVIKPFLVNKWITDQLMPEDVKSRQMMRLSGPGCWGHRGRGMTAHILITGKGPGLRRPEDQRREDRERQTERNTTEGCKICKDEIDVEWLRKQTSLVLSWITMFQCLFSEYFGSICWLLPWYNLSVTSVVCAWCQEMRLSETCHSHSSAHHQRWDEETIYLIIEVLLNL